MLWAINLPGSTGVIGDTAAAISGSFALESSLPTDADGRALVEAATAREALEIALVGTITVVVGQETLVYTMGPGSIGVDATANRPFWLDGGVLRFEDMAHSANGSDRDFNDHGWIVNLPLISGGVLPPPPPVSPGPVMQRLSIGGFMRPTEGGRGTFLLQRTSFIGSLRVAYGTPTGTATLNTDYTGLAAANGFVEFLDGESSVPIYVDILADAEMEPDETVTITLIPPTDGTYEVGAVALEATMIISDRYPSVILPPAPAAAAVSGLVWYDENANGIFESDDESPQAGVAVEPSAKAGRLRDRRSPTAPDTTSSTRRKCPTGTTAPTSPRGTGSTSRSSGSMCRFWEASPTRRAGPTFFKSPRTWCRSTKTQARKRSRSPPSRAKATSSSQ